MFPYVSLFYSFNLNCFHCHVLCYYCRNLSLFTVSGIFDSLFNAFVCYLFLEYVLFLQGNYSSIFLSM